MSEFFNMGGYAAFVWSSYLLAGAIMVGLLIHSVMVWREQETLLNVLKTLANKNVGLDPVIDQISGTQAPDQTLFEERAS